MSIKLSKTEAKFFLDRGKRSPYNGVKFLAPFRHVQNFTCALNGKSLIAVPVFGRGQTSPKLGTTARGSERQKPADRIRLTRAYHDCGSSGTTGQLGYFHSQRTWKKAN